MLVPGWEGVGGGDHEGLEEEEDVADIPHLWVDQQELRPLPREVLCEEVLRPREPGATPPAEHSYGVFQTSIQCNAKIPKHCSREYI